MECSRSFWYCAILPGLGPPKKLVLRNTSWSETTQVEVSMECSRSFWYLTEHAQRLPNFLAIKGASLAIRGTSVQAVVAIGC